MNDEKKRKIKVGDTVEFIKVPEQNETLKVQVTELRIYHTFQAMYGDIPFQEFDCEGWTIQQMVDGRYEVYSLEQEKAYGALAIGIKY